MGDDGVTATHVADNQILCAHRSLVRLTADPETCEPNGLAVFLTGHVSTPEKPAGASVTLLDAETAAQLVLSIEAAICDAPDETQRAFLTAIAQQRGSH